MRELDTDILVVGGGLGGVAAALAACRAGRTVVLTEETDWIGGQLTVPGRPSGRAPLGRAVRHDRLLPRAARGHPGLLPPVVPAAFRGARADRPQPGRGPGQQALPRAARRPRRPGGHARPAPPSGRLTAAHRAPGRSPPSRTTMSSRSVTAGEPARRRPVPRSAPGTSSTPRRPVNSSNSAASSTPSAPSRAPSSASRTPPRRHSPSTSRASPSASRSPTTRARTTSSTGPPTTTSGAPTGRTSGRARCSASSPRTRARSKPFPRTFVPEPGDRPARRQRRPERRRGRQGAVGLPPHPRPQAAPARRLRLRHHAGQLAAERLLAEAADRRRPRDLGPGARGGTAVVALGPVLAPDRGAPRGRRHRLPRSAAAPRHHRHGRRPRQGAVRPRVAADQGRHHRHRARRRDRLRRPLRPDRVPGLRGVGNYRIDLHPSTGGDNYIDIGSVPFEIPLGALVPRRVRNLLPAGKNIGTTHITNGCYRLHPVEWNIGEVAGRSRRSPPRTSNPTRSRPRTSASRTSPWCSTGTGCSATGLTYAATDRVAGKV